MLESLPLHSTNLLTVLDDGGVIQYESPAIERHYGYDQAELVGKTSRIPSIPPTVGTFSTPFRAS